MSADDPERPELPALTELRARLAATTDAARPAAVARRRASGQRTTRENIADLVDDGSFVEWGGLALAAQARRLARAELIAASPADGLVCGIGTVDGARTMILAYDFTVFAGTQGVMGHKKLDRMLAIAASEELPVVLFAEGGGGRPSDTDFPIIAGLDTPSFLAFARLSGAVPLVGIVSGRCFAGNAALLGCCDVIIATENSNIGMGGPAMVEGGGLGSFAPEEIGPIGVQSKNGVVDVRVADEAAAVVAATRYLGYARNNNNVRSEIGCADQTQLRTALPERRRRAYKIAPIIETIVDSGSLFELRREFGLGIVTAFARIGGRPLGIIANNPYHLGGAIDADAADKAARFLQLCDAYALPIVSLVDTPGFMVGPKAETTALVRHVSRLFVVAGAIRVPLFTIVLRKGYGLGAMAMAGGHFHAPMFTVAWPTGEFGGMGLEGAVRLAMKRQLEAIADEAERETLFQSLVAQAYERGKAINMAAQLELDGVIDPADTRTWILRGLASMKPATMNQPRRRFIDPW